MYVFEFFLKLQWFVNNDSVRKIWILQKNIQICFAYLTQTHHTNVVNVDVSLFVTLSHQNFSTAYHETLYTYS